MSEATSDSSWANLGAARKKVKKTLSKVISNKALENCLFDQTTYQSLPKTTIGAFKYGDSTDRI